MTSDKFLSGSGRTVPDDTLKDVQAIQLDLFHDSESERKPYVIIPQHDVAIELVNDWRERLHLFLESKRNTQAFYNFPVVSFHPDQLHKHGYTIIIPARHQDVVIPSFRLAKNPTEVGVLEYFDLDD